jgi:hypothetical protein
VRKTVWESKSVDLQIESEKLLQMFSYFTKTKNRIALKKRGKATKPFLFNLRKSNFILNYNWNCIANIAVFLSTSLC